MLNWLKNSKTLLKSIVGTIGVKGLSLIISLFTTSAYMHYFDEQEILGVWLALVSMLNWIINFDLGIGNGLRNKLVGVLSVGDKKVAKECISSAYVILGVVSVAILFAGNLILGFINWNNVLNISPEILNATTLTLVVRITFSGVILQFFLRLVISILYAIQKPAIANFITLISHSLILIFVQLFHVQSVETSMVVLAIMQVVTVNIPLLVATILVFVRYLPYGRPSFGCYVHGLAKGILNLGYKFFWIQLSLLIINSTNDFLITNIFEPGYVVEYQVYDKIFSLLASGFSLITVPIWSAVTKAAVEKNKAWIKKTYQMLMIMALGMSLVSIILPMFYQMIVDVWLGDKAIQVNMLNAYTFAIYNAILCFNYASTSIANGLGKLELQIKCNTVAAIFKVPLVYIMAFLVNNWICVIVVNIMIMLPCVVMQPIAILKELKGENPA